MASSASASSAGHGATYTRGAGVPAAAGEHHASWKQQLALLAGGVLWLLALLALVTHDAADAAFSTSGSAI
ncbi:MAG TPA: hypothetical protein VJ743_12215, partial [Albitalea sp.]|nr:hypothetical protein [Albitalea sp.]